MAHYLASADPRQGASVDLRHDFVGEIVRVHRALNRVRHDFLAIHGDVVHLADDADGEPRFIGLRKTWKGVANCRPRGIDARRLAMGLVITTRIGICRCSRGISGSRAPAQRRRVRVSNAANRLRFGGIDTLTQVFCRTVFTHHGPVVKRSPFEIALCRCLDTICIVRDLPPVARGR